jgi:hypothetical protein
MSPLLRLSSLSVFRVVAFYLDQRCVFGALIGFFNAVKSNSLLAIEDYCLG